MDRISALIKSASHPLERELEEQVKKMLSPPPFRSLSELSQILKPSPPYIGPGIWLRAMGTLQKGEDHA